MIHVANVHAIRQPTPSPNHTVTYRTLCSPLCKFRRALSDIERHKPARLTTDQAIRTPKLRPRWFFVPNIMVRAP